MNINSGTMNFAGVRAVGDVFAAELEALGFRARWVDGAAYGRAGQLVAERPGKDPALRVVLIGHIDTVFEKDSPFQRFERDGDRARGPATTDMKGGDVVMLLALRALHDAGVLDRIDVAGLSRRRRGGLGRAAVGLARGAHGAGGGGGRRPRLRGRRREVRERGGRPPRDRGMAAHRDRQARALVADPARGDRRAAAIYEAARILDTFRRELAPESKDVTFNPGMIVGGTSVEHPEQARGTAFGKTNVIAQTAIVAGDLRTLAPDQLERTRERMKAIVAAALPHTSAEIAFEPGYPPMAPSDGNRRLLALLDEASRDLGLGAVSPVDPRKAGAADISFLAGRVPMALDGLGLKGTGGHTVEETADLTLLAPQAKRVAVLLARLAAGKR